MYNDNKDFLILFDHHQPCTLPLPQPLSSDISLSRRHPSPPPASLAGWLAGLDRWAPEMKGAHRRCRRLRCFQGVRRQSGSCRELSVTRSFYSGTQLSQAAGGSLCSGSVKRRCLHAWKPCGGKRDAASGGNRDWKFFIFSLT